MDIKCSSWICNKPEDVLHTMPFAPPMLLDISTASTVLTQQAKQSFSSNMPRTCFVLSGLQLLNYCVLLFQMRPRTLGLSCSSWISIAKEGSRHRQVHFLYTYHFPKIFVLLTNGSINDFICYELYWPHLVNYVLTTVHSSHEYLCSIVKSIRRWLVKLFLDIDLHEFIAMDIVSQLSKTTMDFYMRWPWQNLFQAETGSINFKDEHIACRVPLLRPLDLNIQDYNLQASRQWQNICEQVLRDSWYHSRDGKPQSLAQNCPTNRKTEKIKQEQIARQHHYMAEYQRDWEMFMQLPT